MTMGLLWDYIPTPYLLKFQGGYPKTFLETISVPTPPFSFGRLSISATFQNFSDIMECVVPCMHTFIHPFMHACIHTYIHKSLLNRTNHCKLIGQITKSLNGAHRDDPCCWMAPQVPHRGAIWPFANFSSWWSLPHRQMHHLSWPLII